ncbi:hypothetical protein FEM48_Zijuj05G0052100 [Ziziphus jujuba var. spinosa]|uniref:Uncharacterized protein n=1 Tax=Ziziphus jujuba var. spinosa TaxID=714518 RepID=A0A978VD06_ZIZJJ|nr:hypothetical protein FEM48_Zijuj05G0052100 [Ziziphus jujuba var. spinosa]
MFLRIDEKPGDPRDLPRVDVDALGAAMLDDGWLYRGDVTVRNPDGYLKIRDRSKDVIIIGGENLIGVEVESVLYTHPAINEVAVVARLGHYRGRNALCVCELEGRDGKQGDDVILQTQIAKNEKI